jgi:peroxiredoxin
VRTLIALFVMSVAATACRPEQLVLNPDKNKRQAGVPDVQRDVSNQDAPGGTVQSAKGDAVDLASLWQDKRVIVVFYHGHWCPNCQQELGEINEHLREIDAVVIAISSDESADAKALHDKLGLSFELYSDPSLQTIAKWGVEDYSANIAQSATFVVEPGGKISYRKVGEKKTDHPSIDELVAVTKQKS